jgi:hypothetical protein
MSLTAKMAVAALSLGVACPAWAGAGNGIRFGGSEGRLHPFIELEARYDSNVYVNGVDVTQGDLVLHYRPGLKLEVPGEMTSVEASAKLDYAQYLGLEDSSDPDAGTSTDLSKLYAEAALGITVNRTGLVGLELDDTFRRSDQPQSLSLGAGVVSNYNALTVRVPWRPGGGALTFGLGGTWALETYERFLPGSLCAVGALCDTAVLDDLGYNDVSGAADLRWKFLPRTSATFMAEYFKRLPNKTSVVPGVENDPGGYRVKAGVTGLVTAHLSATLEAGYGGTAGVTDTFGTWLAAAQLKWLPTETASVALTYSHDLRIDPTVQYDLNSLRLEARQLVAGRYALKVAASYSRLGYQNGLGNTGILSVMPAVEAELARWLRAELGYVYTDRASSAAANAALATADYGKSEVWLKAVLTY